MAYYYISKHKDLKQDYIEHQLNERVLAAIIEILAILDLFTDNIDIELTTSKLINYTDKLIFLNQNQNITSIYQLAS